MSHASQEIIARLLATENITVIHENIPTAAFNVKERTLHLPLWEDMDGDTYSHLIGHEVGHALYTPEDGWHDAVCDRGGVFKQFLNVIEDARIEKLVQRRYPGLRRSFIKSYKKMLADGFFGANIDQINSGNLIDRINTYFKCGMSAGIIFEQSERGWLDEIAAAESWEQVEDIANRLFEFAREQTEKKIEEEEQKRAQMKTESEGEESEDDDEPMNDSESDSFEEGDDDFDDMFGGHSETTESAAPTDTSSQWAQEPTKPEDKVESEMKSKTDDNIRRSIDAEYGNMTDGIVKNAMFADFDLDILSYKDVFEEVDKANASEGSYFRLNEFVDAGEKLWQRFNSENKRVVNHMVKEFEMRKKAAEYVRATTAKTGVIDNVKMNNYKLSDDIFKKITIVPEGKNHGFIIWLDYSGSMSDCLFDAVGQALTLAMFCRQASIPFKLMSFTSGWRSGEERPLPADNYVAPASGTSYIELFNDKMRKSEFARMASYSLAQAYSISCTRKLYNEYEISRYYRIPEILCLGGTPLDEVILGTIKLHDTFKSQRRLDKVNTFFITDGESHPFEIAKTGKNYQEEVIRGTTDFDMYGSTRDENFYRLVDVKTGRRYRMARKHGDYRNSMTNQCLRLYRDRTGSMTIGYRIIGHSARDVQSIAEPLQNDSLAIWDQVKSDKIAEVKNSGYDQYFLISKKGLRVETGNMEVKGDMTKMKLRTAFRKSQGGKKTSRELANRIMKLVA